MKCKTVKDLKEFISHIPDDALIYEQITAKGKHLEAINIHHQEHEGKVIYTYYDFPDFIVLPLSTEPTFEALERYYNNEEKI